MGRSAGESGPSSAVPVENAGEDDPMALWDRGEARASGAPEPPPGSPRGEDPPSFGPTLLAWMALVLLIQAAVWFAGPRTTALAVAVEEGAARAESLFIGEVADDVIRKAVRAQRDTLPFWTVMSFLGDFLGEPFLVGARALGAATAFAAFAALMGRPIGYDRALADCARAQGIWVLGMATQAALMIAMRTTEVETSAALFVPPGECPAWLWLSARQVDFFALVGWAVIGAGGVRRGQVGPIGAFLVCGGFWLAEGTVRVGLGLLLGAGARLSVTAG